MPLISTKIRSSSQQGPNHLILRQSRRVFYQIISIGLAAVLVYLLMIYIGIALFPQTGAMNRLGVFVETVLGVAIILIMIVIFGYVLSRLINYFYTVYLIDDSRVVKICYGTNFNSEVVTLDIDKVIYNNTDQSGILQSTLNYGDVHLHLVSDDELILENIPDPKQVIMEIEKLQEYANESRSGSSSKDTSSKDTSSKDTSSKDTSSKDTSSKDTSSKDTSKINTEQRKQLKKEIKKEIEEDLKEEIKQEVERELAVKLLEDTK